MSLKCQAHRLPYNSCHPSASYNIKFCPTWKILLSGLHEKALEYKII